MPATPQPWYTSQPSQLFGQHGEQGIDLPQPFHTPITSLYSGVVQSAQYTSYGSDVKINIAGAPGWQEEFLHNDVLLVQPGQQVLAGQVIGLSGGETPQQALSLRGAQHPAYVGSTGPHVEFDLSNQGQYVNPAGIIAAVAGGQSVAGSPLAQSNVGGSTGAPQPSGPASWIQQVLAGFAGVAATTGASGQLLGQGVTQTTLGATTAAQNAPAGSSLGADIGSGLASGLTSAFSSLFGQLAQKLINWEIRGTLVAVGVLLALIVIVWLLFSSNTGQRAVATGAAVAKVAAK